MASGAASRNVKLARLIHFTGIEDARNAIALRLFRRKRILVTRDDLRLPARNQSRCQGQKQSRWQRPGASFHAP